MTSNLLTGWMKRVGDRDSFVHQIVVILQYWKNKKYTTMWHIQEQFLSAGDRKGTGDRLMGKGNTGCWQACWHSLGNTDQSYDNIQ